MATNSLESWCVCGAESKDDPYDVIEGDFTSLEQATSFLRANNSDYPQYRHFYIDREDNERGPAEAYYDRQPDGSLVGVSAGGVSLGEL